MNRNLLAIFVDQDDQPGGGVQPKTSHHRLNLVIALFAHQDGTIRHLGISTSFACRKRGGRFNNFVTRFELLEAYSVSFSIVPTPTTEFRRAKIAADTEPSESH